MEGPARGSPVIRSRKRELREVPERVIGSIAVVLLLTMTIISSRSWCKPRTHRTDGDGAGPVLDAQHRLRPRWSGRLSRDRLRPNPPFPYVRKGSPARPFRGCRVAAPTLIGIAQNFDTRESARLLAGCTPDQYCRGASFAIGRADRSPLGRYGSRRHTAE